MSHRMQYEMCCGRRIYLSHTKCESPRSFYLPRVTLVPTIIAFTNFTASNYPISHRTTSMAEQQMSSSLKSPGKRNVAGAYSIHLIGCPRDGPMTSVGHKLSFVDSFRLRQMDLSDWLPYFKQSLFANRRDALHKSLTEWAKQGVRFQSRARLPNLARETLGLQEHSPV